MSKSSFSRRMDTRTPEEFERDIINRTLKERFLARLFVLEMRECGSTVIVEEVGNKNAGKIVSKSSCEPDYKFIIDGKTYLVDIKNCGISTKATFKLYQLQQYIKYGASILLFIGTGFIDNDPTQIAYESTQWALIKPHYIENMIEKTKPYKDPNFGYKECIRITANNFHHYFKLNKLKIGKVDYFQEMDLNAG